MYVNRSDDEDHERCRAQPICQLCGEAGVGSDVEVGSLRPTNLRLGMVNATHWCTSRQAAIKHDDQQGAAGRARWPCSAQLFHSDLRRDATRRDVARRPSRRDPSRRGFATRLRRICDRSRRRRATKLRRPRDGVATAARRQNTYAKHASRGVATGRATVARRRRNFRRATRRKSRRDRRESGRDRRGFATTKCDERTRRLVVSSWGLKSAERRERAMAEPAS